MQVDPGLIGITLRANPTTYVCARKLKNSITDLNTSILRDVSHLKIINKKQKKNMTSLKKQKIGKREKQQIRKSEKQKIGKSEKHKIRKT